MALNDLTAPAVLQAIAEFDRIGRNAFLQKYAIGKARGFWVVHEDRAYDSKALAGAAHGYLAAQSPLRADSFSGGEQTVERVLTDLGFRVETPAASDELPDLDLSISPYEDGPSPPIRRVNGMVPLLRGDDYHRDNVVDTDRQKWFYRELGRIYRVTESIQLPIAFNARGGSYRLDTGNVGHAVAEAMLVPLENDRLVETVRVTPAFLRQHGGLGETLGAEAAAESPIPIPDVNDAPNLHIVPPPAPTVTDRKRAAHAVLNNWGVQDAANRKLGAAGEEWVIRYERRRLEAANQEQLANRVRHVAKEIGDGLGYDITSFDVDGSPIWIEVKTTTRGILVPFFLSSHEIDVSKEQGRKFRLYRVFKFRTATPQIYILEGPLTEKCELTPISYRAIPL
jgi:hypothetical protein